MNALCCFSHFGFFALDRRCRGGAVSVSYPLPIRSLVDACATHKAARQSETLLMVFCLEQKCSGQARHLQLLDVTQSRFYANFILLSAKPRLNATKPRFKCLTDERGSPKKVKAVRSNSSFLNSLNHVNRARLPIWLTPTADRASPHRQVKPS